MFWITSVMYILPTSLYENFIVLLLINVMINKSDDAYLHLSFPSQKSCISSLSHPVFNSCQDNYMYVIESTVFKVLFFSS